MKSFRQFLSEITETEFSPDYWYHATYESHLGSIKTHGFKPKISNFHRHDMVYSYYDRNNPIVSIEMNDKGEKVKHIDNRVLLRVHKKHFDDSVKTDAAGLLTRYPHPISSEHIELYDEKNNKWDVLK